MLEIIDLCSGRSDNWASKLCIQQQFQKMVGQLVKNKKDEEGWKGIEMTWEPVDGRSREGKTSKMVGITILAILPSSRSVVHYLY